MYITQKELKALEKINVIEELIIKPIRVDSGVTRYALFVKTTVHDGYLRIKTYRSEPREWRNVDALRRFIKTSCPSQKSVRVCIDICGE